VISIELTEQEFVDKYIKLPIFANNPNGVAELRETYHFLNSPPLTEMDTIEDDPCIVLPPFKRYRNSFLI